MNHKLDEETAKVCAAQLLEAIDRIKARHEWSDGDLLAVTSLAFTEVVARTVGPARAAGFFRDHAEALAAEHAKRSTI